MEGNKFLGIVTINRLLANIKTHTELVEQMTIPAKKGVITVQKDKTVGFAYSLIRDKHVSRLPVVDEKGKLVGIVTRFDIQYAFMVPREREGFLSRSGEKENFLTEPLSKYYIKLVVSVSESAQPAEILSLLIDKKIGSVVVVDQHRKPVNIISSHDVLKSIGNLTPKTPSQLNVNAPDDFVHRVKLEEILSSFIDKINKREPIKKLDCIVTLKKNPGGKVAKYGLTMHLYLENGRMVKTQNVDFDWKKAAHLSLERLSKQLGYK